MSSLADEFVIVAERSSTGFDMNDFTVLEAIKRQNGLGCGTVGEVSDGVSNGNIVVLKQDSVGFGLNGAHAGKTHDVGLGHDGSTHVRVELAIVVDEGEEFVSVPGFKGFSVSG